MEETKNVVTNENFDWNAYENDLGVYDHPKEEIAEAYDKTLSNVNVGEVVEGTVTGITKREVLVNIGYKSEGVIPVSEFRYNPDLRSAIRSRSMSSRPRTRADSWFFRTRRHVSSNRGIV